MSWLLVFVDVLLVMNASWQGQWPLNTAILIHCFTVNVPVCGIRLLIPQIPVNTIILWNCPAHSYATLCTMEWNNQKIHWANCESFSLETLHRPWKLFTSHQWYGLIFPEFGFPDRRQFIWPVAAEPHHWKYKPKIRNINQTLSDPHMLLIIR